jgi:4-diphosphocytidyl-2-C-methyl-D-erythritol kinase
MFSERHKDAVVVWAPAKVNLYLEVLNKRADGYHEIATLMAAVSLYDTLEFKEDSSHQIVLQIDHPTLSTAPDNLVLRAAELLRQRMDLRKGARIRLRKRIPLAAGLAGGSTDAAATLAGLNRLWRLRLGQSDLAALGSELGSDVPFFFATPAAWCTGRGEVVEPIAHGAVLWFVIVCPAVGLSTASVYRQVVLPESPGTGERIRRAVQEGQVEEIGARLHNRLQTAAQLLCPAVADWLDRLKALKPAGQLMSGSGSSVFALCRNRGEALRIARALRHGSVEEQRPSVFMVRSCF